MLPDLSRTNDPWIFAGICRLVLWWRDDRQGPPNGEEGAGIVFVGNGPCRPDAA
jgi:hypothetical protein